MERTYEEDVYSKKAKKDGTHTLLHKAGETSISYSVSRIYEGAYYDNHGKRHYPFMESYHQQVIERMQNNLGLSDEIRQTAGKLLNGATKKHGPFSPRDYNREQRDESVFLPEANRVLEAKTAEMQARLDDAQKSVRQAEAHAEEAEASALLEADSTRDVNLSMFTTTPQRYGYAISQIKKAAQEILP